MTTSPTPARAASPFLLLLRALLLPGWAAFRTYWKLFVVIQGGALAVVILYWTSPEVQTALEVLADWKQQGGLLFSALATMVMSGVVPEVLKIFARPAHLPKPRKNELLDQLAMFAMFGALVDLFYRFQGWLFGDSSAWHVVAAKVAVDQFLFSPLFAIPIAVTWFMWREHGYRLLPALRAWSPRVYRERVLPIWATAMAYWIPMVSLIYSMPASLQIPLFLGANSAWALIFIFIARRQVEAGAGASRTPAAR